MQPAHPSCKDGALNTASLCTLRGPLLSDLARSKIHNWLTVSPRGSGTGILPSVQELEEGLGHGRWGICSSLPASLSCKGQSQQPWLQGPHQPEMDLSCSRVGWAVATRWTGLWGRLRSKWGTDHLPPPPYHFLLRPGIIHSGCRHYWDAQGPACPDPPMCAQRSA